VKFTAEEDEKLLSIVKEHGSRDWVFVALLHGTRNPRQCRERYANYLAPSLRHDGWTVEEDALLLQKYSEYGPKWNKIARVFTNRSDNALRNRWQLMNRRQLRSSPQFCPVIPSPDSQSAPSQPKDNHNDSSQIPSTSDADWMAEFLPALQGNLPDVMSIEAKPESCLCSLFDLREQVQGTHNIFNEDPFDYLRGFCLCKNCI
jgi:hypothetical protein